MMMRFKKKKKKKRNDIVAFKNKCIGKMIVKKREGI